MHRHLRPTGRPPRSSHAPGPAPHARASTASLQAGAPFSPGASEPAISSTACICAWHGRCEVSLPLFVSATDHASGSPWLAAAGHTRPTRGGRGVPAGGVSYHFVLGTFVVCGQTDEPHRLQNFLGCRKVGRVLLRVRVDPRWLRSSAAPGGPVSAAGDSFLSWWRASCRSAPASHRVTRSDGAELRSTGGRGLCGRAGPPASAGDQR